MRPADRTNAREIAALYTELSAAGREVGEINLRSRTLRFSGAARQDNSYPNGQRSGIATQIFGASVENKSGPRRAWVLAARTLVLTCKTEIPLCARSPALAGSLALP